MIEAIYVDDEPKAAQTQKIKEFLTSDDLNCELRDPPADISEASKWNPDILFVDYNLAHAETEFDGRHISYSGNSLATELRNRSPFCPIILVSRENILSGRGSHLTTSGSDLDLIFYKNDIINHRDETLQYILELHEAYMQLKEIKNLPWSKVLDKLGADEDEQRKIREAFPPVSKGRRWYVPTTIEWIRTVLIGYPGILYNSLHASARLGITELSFLSPAILDIFASAKYKGLLAGFGERWWADRLVAKATEIIIEANVDGPFSVAFAEAYEQMSREKLEPSRCVFDNEPVADQVCYILKKPVKRDNSIVYYPDSRPPVMDPARVSIKAIQESDDFDEDLVEASSFSVVKRIWDRGERCT
ncbi:MAG: hypothetical protein OXG53_06000 [Chloroflexi bacterium]|nr:hypothetical protein [Chloroflexota bacterium]